MLIITDREWIKPLTETVREKSLFRLITKTSHTQNELSTLKTQYYSETNMKFRQQQAF